MFGRASLPAFAAWEAVLPGGVQAKLIPACRAAFGYSKNPSFWVGAFSKAQNVLDRFALDVFWFHAERLQLSPEDVRSHGRRAGAEFWVQLRSAAQPWHERGMDWHFDKDEELLDKEDVALTPTVATVTYLRNSGAPLVVLSQPTLSSNGFTVQLLDNEDLIAYVTKPVLGRHVAFDGGLLHGCPSKLAGKGERLALVVNVWLEHRPIAASRTSTHPSLRQCGDAVCEPECMHPGGAFAASQSLMLENRRAEAEVAADAWPLLVVFGPWEVSGVYVPNELRPGRPNFMTESTGPWALRHRRNDVCLELPGVSTPSRQSSRTRRRPPRGLRARQSPS